MNKSLRTLWMRLSFVVLILAGGLMTQPLHASELKQKESVVHVGWSATEQDLQDLLQELKGLDVQKYDDEATAPYSDVPVTASWTSAEMSAGDLASWVRSQPYQGLVAGPCVLVRITIQIYSGGHWTTVRVYVRVCINNS
jgi:hypothetical protein